MGNELEILMRQWKDAIETLPDTEPAYHLKILYLANMEAARAVHALVETQSKIITAIIEIREAVIEIREILRGMR